MVNEFKQHLITIYYLPIYSDIQYHDNAKSKIGMAITRSPDPSQIYISQKGLEQLTRDLDELGSWHPLEDEEIK